MTDTLRRQAEMYLGTRIEASELDNAEERAKRKLRLIISREGDADGQRLEPWYMAQLIAEIVRSSRMTALTINIAELEREVKRKMGIKNEQPV